MANPDDTDVIHESTTQARETMDRAAGSVHETVDRVHRRATEMTDQVTTEADRYYQSATQWITAHPMQALLGALFAGYLVGRMRR